MPFNTLRGTLRRPYSGIGQSQFDVTLDLDLQSIIEQSMNNIFLGTGRKGIPIVLRGNPAGGGGGGGGGNRRTIPEGFVVVSQYDRQSGTHVDQYLRRKPGFTGDLPPGYEPPPGIRLPGAPSSGGRGFAGNTRFSAYSPGSSFYGGAGAGFGSIALGGTRIGLGAGLGVGSAIFAAGAIKELSQELITASASFETFERTVRATEQTSADAEIRWARLLEIANETVGIDVSGIVQYNSQLRAIEVEAHRVDAVIRATTKSVSELGRGVHVTREALNQLTDGIVRNHLNVRDWRAIVARIPQFLDAASRALGQTILSLDDFRNAADANSISISEGILRSMEELDKTAQGLQGTYVAAVDRMNEASFKLKATIGEPLKDAITPVISAIAASMNTLNDALQGTPNPFERFQEQLNTQQVNLDKYKNYLEKILPEIYDIEGQLLFDRFNNNLTDEQSEALRNRLKLLEDNRRFAEDNIKKIGETVIPDNRYRLINSSIEQYQKKIEDTENTLRELQIEDDKTYTTLATVVGLISQPIGTIIARNDPIVQATLNLKTYREELEKLEEQRRTLQLEKGLIDNLPSIPPQAQKPTDASLEYFENLTSQPAIIEEFVRQNLIEAGGDFNQQVIDTEKLITETIKNIRNAIPEDTQKQNAYQQKIVQGLKDELGQLYVKLRVLKELATEQEREKASTIKAQADFQKAAEQSIRAIGQQATALQEAEAAAKAFNEQMQTLADNVYFADLQQRGNFIRSIHDRNIGELIHRSRTQSIQEREFEEFIERATGIATSFISGNPNLSTRQILENRRLNRTQIPPREEFEEFIERATGIATSFISGNPNLSTRQILENRRLNRTQEDLEAREEYQRKKQQAEREDLQRQRRYARQYQRIWENTFGSIANTAIDAIFDRSISLTDALASIAQNTLKDLAGFYLNQFLGGGNVSGLLGSSSAAGAGVALGGAGVLFPNEFANLFEEIGKSFSFLSRPDRLFHSSESDMYAATLGARTQRAIEGDSPTARQNARDFADNFSQGFQTAARETQRGESVPLDTPLVIQVNFGNSENAMIEIGASLRDLIEKGIISLDVP